jgi:hypothetical protein
VADWEGHAAVVVASGPTATAEPLEPYRDRAKFIVINDSWKLAPWADVLFACDEAWWHANNGCPQFKGRRVTASPNCMKQYGIDLFCSTGANSGLRGIYLAQRLGANPICMVGFDMHSRNGVHWHKPYEHERLRNPGANEMRTWRNETEWAAERFKAKGVFVVNCTPGSALTKYPYIPLGIVLSHATSNARPADPTRSAIVAR